ncbi:HNH endonuclease [Monashia sp. NPDC004114]
MSTRKGRALTADDLGPCFWFQVDAHTTSDDTEDGCWVWHGATNNHGYARMVLRGGRYVYAHRATFAATWGEVAADAVLRHSCDNPRCIRPDHLIAGTQADNLRDMAVKGRGTVKISNADVPRVRALVASGMTQRAVAARFGVAPCTVSHIVTGRNRRYVGEVVR